MAKTTLSKIKAGQKFKVLDPFGADAGTGFVYEATTDAQKCAARGYVRVETTIVKALREKYVGQQQTVNTTGSTAVEVLA